LVEWLSGFEIGSAKEAQCHYHYRHYHCHCRCRCHCPRCCCVKRVDGFNNKRERRVYVSEDDKRGAENEREREGGMCMGTATLHCCACIMRLCGKNMMREVALVQFL